MLQQGQIAEAVITDYTTEGEGVCRIEGCVVFVPGAICGENCEIRVMHVGQHSAHGKILRVLTPSPHREKPGCPWSDRCGGCSFWHMDYAEECRLKAQRVADALTRIGGLEVETVPILGAASAEGYRNKAQFPVQTQNGAICAGFYRERTHTVIPMDRCRIQDPAADEARKLILQWAKKYGVSAYDEQRRTGLLRHIFVRKGFATGQIMVCLVVNGDRLPQEDALVARLRWGVKGLRSVLLCDNRAVGNVILSDRFRTLYGQDYIEDTLCGLTFRLSARSFYQVNHDQAERLYEMAVAAAQLTGNETVLDLYCGTGTITLTLAKRAKRVLGVEIIPQAIEDAKKNARRNGVENAEFFCADAKQAAAQLAQAGTQPDVIVVDPPRKGLDAAVIEAIAQMAPSRVVYVSCDPATLARDCKLLSAHGYTLRSAQAVDMFPRTAHVETVVQLVRKNPDMTVSVTLNLEDADLTASETKATYDQIKAYVQETFGLRVTSLQIAQTKRKLGLPTGEHYNLSQKENQVIPNCPPEKESAIQEALRHFRMI